MTMVRAGRMRQKVIIQELTDAKGAQGGRSETWATFQNVWAAIKPLRGREYFAADQAQSRVSHEIRTRWISGVTPKMRVTYDSRTFRIQSAINEDERDQVLLLMCEEII